MQAGGPSAPRPLVGHGVPKAPRWNRKLALLDKKDADRVRKCSSPDGYTYLQLFDTKKNNLFVVKSPPESFIIRAGEAADILSQLRTKLSLIPAYLSDSETSRKLLSSFKTSGTCDKKKKKKASLSSFITETQEPLELVQEILKKIPPSSQLRNVMTFAEFSCETTRQCYSGSGPQSAI
ncbi:uncharacterized protein [Elaeis guineensis]|uniref:uncharacterized protein n=1 Tax=Elaeis guineensis var. tenera TaxID=51953 RepID=UPI003C6D69EF